MEREGDERGAGAAGGGVAMTGDGGRREMRGLAALTGMVVNLVMHGRPAQGAQDGVPVGAAGVRTRRSRPRSLPAQDAAGAAAALRGHGRGHGHRKMLLEGPAGMTHDGRARGTDNGRRRRERARVHAGMRE